MRTAGRAAGQYARHAVMLPLRFGSTASFEEPGGPRRGHVCTTQLGGAEWLGVDPLGRVLQARSRTGPGLPDHRASPRSPAGPPRRTPPARPTGATPPSELPDRVPAIGRRLHVRREAVLSGCDRTQSLASFGGELLRRMGGRGDEHGVAGREVVQDVTGFMTACAASSTSPTGCSRIAASAPSRICLRRASPRAVAIIGTPRAQFQRPAGVPCTAMDLRARGGCPTPRTRSHTPAPSARIGEAACELERRNHVRGFCTARL
jgi:hypothetical protein